jgi:hypothetical protein
MSLRHQFFFGFRFWLMLKLMMILSDAFPVPSARLGSTL